MPSYSQNARRTRARREASLTRPPVGGMLSHAPGDRHYGEQTGNLTPARVGSIMAAAVGGDVRDQYKLCQEVAEKDDAIQTALQTRAGAVAATEWTVDPADDSPRAKKIAEEVEALLLDPAPCRGELSFRQYCRWAVESSLLPNFSAAEIVWSPGYKSVSFVPVDAHHFDFQNSPEPLFVDASGARLPLEQGKWIVHQPQPGKDPARGGLIRPLAWIYCFKNLNLKDWLRYTEKFGMPFLLGRLDADAWDRERNRMTYLVKNFGADGAGVFTKSVDLQMLSPNQSSLNLYLENQGYWERTITKLILGQTSTTSSEDSNRSTAAVHNEVRADLLANDWATLAETVNRDLIAVYVRLHYGPDAPVPVLNPQTDPPEDLGHLADVVAKLDGAGHRADSEWIEETFGITLAKSAPQPEGAAASAASPAGPDQAVDAAAGASALVEGEKLNGAQINAAKEVLQDLAAGRMTDLVAQELLVAVGIPTDRARRMVESAKTIKSPDAVVMGEGAESFDRRLAAAAVDEFLTGEGLEEWLGPIRRAVEVALAAATPEAFDARLRDVLRQLPDLYRAMDSTKLQDLIERVQYAAAAQATADRADQLKAQEGRSRG